LAARLAHPDSVAALRSHAFTDVLQTAVKPEDSAHFCAQLAAFDLRLVLLETPILPALTPYVPQPVAAQYAQLRDALATCMDVTLTGVWVEADLDNRHYLTRPDAPAHQAEATEGAAQGLRVGAAQDIDPTHLNPAGARRFSAAVARALSDI
jgi:lysophospholipase L1-like esterase